MWEILGAEWQAFLAVGGFLVFFLLESLAPFFHQKGRVRHAARNLTVAAVNIVALAFLLSGLTVSVAHVTAARQWGLLNHFPWGPAGTAVAGFLILDLWMYWWHRANHQIPFLWRFHRMHHSDPAMDVSTATRFHLGEITLSALVRLGLIPLAGIPLFVIVGYELALLLTTQFHHSNIRLPAQIDRAMRFLIVSPNMHRVHHSIERVETDSNYASVLSVWDRLFRSYRERADYHQIRFGVKGLSDDWFQGVRGLMLTPILPREKSARA